MPTLINVTHNLLCGKR